MSIRCTSYQNPYLREALKEEKEKRHKEVEERMVKKEAEEKKNARELCKAQR